MRFMVCVNNNEAVANGDEKELWEIRDEVEELLRSGYYEVEYIDECEDDE